MADEGTGVTLAFGCGLSGNLDATLASEQACDRALEELGRAAVHFAVLFSSGTHVDQASRIADVARARLSPTTLIGTTAASLIGGASELEGVPGVSVLAGHMPGVQIRPFDERDILPFDDTTDTGLERLGMGFGSTDQTRGTLIFVDPFSVPLVRLLPAMNRARVNTSPIFGGVASGANEPGGNALILNDNINDRGLVGVTFEGDVAIDTVISQGCRSIGPNFIVTKAKNNLILELGGQPALVAVQQALGEMGEETQDLLRKGGLLIGRVVNEYKERFGRDDYLIRNVVGADESSGGIAWGDLVKVGQTVAMHVRDPQSAHDDLAMLLDAQKLHDRPAGALLFPCTSRGSEFFGEPNHDSGAFARAFSPAVAPAESQARSGEEISAGETPSGEAAALPQAGFFAAGEIGPVGDDSFLHGHTLSAALFREPA